jgi:dephospho-CoA kinase
MTEDDARSRIRAQATEKDRRAAADVWIDNVGDVAEVREQVRALWSGRIVPFEAGVRAGRAAPWPDAVVDPDPTWPAQARRLAARIEVAGQGHVESVEHVGPTAVRGRAAPDVLDLVVHETGGDATGELAAALAGAGFPRVDDALHGGADPGRPVRIRRS